MKRLPLFLHAIMVIGVLGLCFWEGTLAIEFYGNEYLALTYARSVPAFLCGSYALTHVILLAKKQMTLQAMVWFYPICFLMGAIATFVSQAHGKHWAPANAAEALRASLIGFSVVAALWLTAVYSCYRAFASHRSNHAQPGAPGDAGTATRPRSA